jgi:ActR/RegA family two-component response regulator
MRAQKIKETREQIDYLEKNPQAMTILTALHDRKKCSRTGLAMVVPPEDVEQHINWMSVHMLIQNLGNNIAISERGLELFDKVRVRQERRKDETGNLFGNGER